jgi:hypothetical protein
MVLVNTTQNQISGGCLPNLEKKVNGKWVTAHFGVMLGCNGLTLELERSYRDTVPYFASNITTELRGAPIEGTYRLRWRFVEGKDLSDERARKVEAISNEFHLIRQVRPDNNLVPPRYLTNVAADGRVIVVGLSAPLDLAYASVDALLE